MIFAILLLTFTGAHTHLASMDTIGIEVYGRVIFDDSGSNYITVKFYDKSMSLLGTDFVETSGEEYNILLASSPGDDCKIIAEKSWIPSIQSEDDIDFPDDYVFSGGTWSHFKSFNW